jgi:hypothetical protein
MAHSEALLPEPAVGKYTGTPTPCRYGARRRFVRQVIRQKYVCMKRAESIRRE